MPPPFGAAVGLRGVPGPTDDGVSTAWTGAGVRPPAQHAHGPGHSQNAPSARPLAKPGSERGHLTPRARVERPHLLVWQRASPLISGARFALALA
jgi:hypothetical protein